MKKVFPALLSLIICFNLSAYSQNDAVLQNIVSKLKLLSADHIIEKAYLHFDKPYYAAGDTMYFKAYVTLGERHDLSKASGILYVDLISPKNISVASIKIQLVDGVGWGDFALPDSWQEGNYRVRAYTKYMRNDPDYFFDQVIPIGSVSNNSVAENSTAMAQSVKADVQFFPEGGDLVTGLVSKVAFKAIGTNGLGINVKGLIVDNTNNEVSRFSSTHLGMGIFYFEPQEGKSYKAKITYADGSQNTVDLPKPKLEGIVLAVSDTLDKMSIEMHCNKAYLQNNLNKDVNLVVYSGGMVTSVNTKLDNRAIGMDVPNKNFVSGIVKVTLFSQSGEPLSERLLFLQNHDLLNLAVTSNKTAYKNNEKVQINVNAKNNAGTAAAGHFSVAVIDESKLPVDENIENTILTNLLLTADLKGYVEKPNYYFSNNTKNTSADLDALMLTQGYRRFSWKELLNDSYPKFTIPSETAFAIAGQAKIDGAPMAKKSILLRATSDAIFGNRLLSQQTDETGKFKFEGLVFNKTAQFVIQSEKSKGKTAQITLDAEEPGPVVSNNNLPGRAGDVNVAMQVYLNNVKEQSNFINNNTVVLENINVKGKPLYKSSSLSGAGNADQVLINDDIRGFANLSDVLNGKLHGGYVQSGIPYLSSSRTIGAGMAANEPMLVIVDGVSYSGSIDNFSTSSIETIEVLKSQNAAIYGVQGASGVLVINTKQTTLLPESQTTPLGVLQFKRTGFYKAREFYSPKYETTDRANNQPDLRTTIFWKPELLTDKDGNASFDYYNADGHGTYRLVIEGIDEKGNIGRQVYRYKVE
jgi:hypothetical protein